MKINSIIDLVKDLDTSRQTKNLNKLLIRILLHLQVEFSTDLGNGMKEYINNNCGFSCQYPSTWETIGKSDTEQILQLRGHGVSSLTVSYIKAPSKEAMEHMYDLLINSMKDSRSENINIHGKTFERISGKMECAVAGGGSIHINQNIVIHMNEKTLENFIITSTTSDDSSESEIQEIIKTIRIN